MLYAVLYQLNDKEQGMLDERIKRSSKSARPSSAQTTMSSTSSRMSPDEKQPRIPPVRTGTVTVASRT